MTTNRTLILDIDEVILSWTTGFKQWMHYVKGIPPTGPVASYSMSETWPEFSSDEIQRMIAEFNESPQFGALPFIDGAIKTVELIRSYRPNYRVIAVTACGRKAVTHLNRLRNLECLGLEEVHMIGLGESKVKHFTTYAAIGRTVVVEDSPKGLAEAKFAGCYAVRFDQPWNKHLNDTYPVIEGWVQDGVAIDTINDAMDGVYGEVAQ